MRMHLHALSRASMLLQDLCFYPFPLSRVVPPLGYHVHTAAINRAPPLSPPEMLHSAARNPRVSRDFRCGNGGSVGGVSDKWREKEGHKSRSTIEGRIVGVGVYRCRTLIQLCKLNLHQLCKLNLHHCMSYVVPKSLACILIYTSSFKSYELTVT